MTLWVYCFIVCVFFGTKAFSGIRHYLISEKQTKSKVKVIDLVAATLLGAIPLLNLILAIAAIALTIFFIFVECIEFKKSFFNRNLFDGNDED